MSTMTTDRIGASGSVDVWVRDSKDFTATVADVRQWLRHVESLGIPDNTLLDECFLHVRVSTENVEGIEDGELSGKRDVLLVLSGDAA